MYGKDKRMKKMGGGYADMMRKKKGMGGSMRKPLMKGGSVQPMYGHGECPKAKAN